MRRDPGHQLRPGRPRSAHAVDEHVDIAEVREATLTFALLAADGAVSRERPGLPRAEARVVTDLPEPDSCRSSRWAIRSFARSPLA